MGMTFARNNPANLIWQLGRAVVMHTARSALFRTETRVTECAAAQRRTTTYTCCVCHVSPGRNQLSSADLPIVLLAGMFDADSGEYGWQRCTAAATSRHMTPSHRTASLVASASTRVTQAVRSTRSEETSLSLTSLSLTDLSSTE